MPIEQLKDSLDAHSAKRLEDASLLASSYLRSDEELPSSTIDLQLLGIFLRYTIHTIVYSQYFNEEKLIKNLYSEGIRDFIICRINEAATFSHCIWVLSKVEGESISCV